MSKVNVKEMSLELVDVLGHRALFTEDRVDKTTIPEGIYYYELRHGDDFGFPCTLESDVVVNYFGAIFSKEPLLMDEENSCVSLDGDFGYTDDSMTISYYINQYDNFEGEQADCMSSLNKEDWVKQQLDMCPIARKEVLEFIANIVFSGGELSRDIIGKFKNEFCYYFANMLQNAFGSCGQLYFDVRSNSIVWGSGTTGICYSVMGAFVCDISTLKSIDQIGSYLEFFKQGGYDRKVKKELASFAKEKGVTVNELMRQVYESIPEERRLLKHFNLIDVYANWYDYQEFLCDI